MKKCGLLSLKRGKVKEKYILPNEEIMKSVDEDGYKYLWILELDRIKEKEKVKKEYNRRLRSILKSKLNRKNKIQGINTWAVALIRYGGGLLDWNVEEEMKMDRQTRKDDDNVWSTASKE